MCSRGLVRMGGVGDPPLLDRGVIDALDEQACAVGEPPVATDPVKLLRGDEVGKPPGDLVCIRCAHDPRRSAFEGCDPEGTVADVGDMGARGVWAGIDDGARSGQHACWLIGVETARIRRAREREDGDAAVAIGGVVGDAGAHLAHALASGALLRRKRFGILQQIARIDDARLLAGRQVEGPQTGDGVRTAMRAQEEHALSLRVDGEGARCAETEAARAGSLAWVGLVAPGLGHAPILPEAPAVPHYPVRMTDRRILLVHAHPDDETIGTGAVMARYVDAGVGVTLVTCTLGEEGEILVPGLEHLASDREDRLGEHRQGELAEAMGILGVTDWRLLGAPGRYRDSGMAGTGANDREGAFWRSDLLEAAAHLVGVIREVRPQVLVTYDDFGGYGHPDHIQAHRVAMYAATLASARTFRPDLGEPWDIAKIYWTAFPRSIVREGIEKLRAAGETTGFAEMDPDDIPFAIEDELVTTAVRAPEHLERKLDALRAHATQVTVDGGFFALADNVGAEAFGTEYFRLVKGAPAGPFDGAGRETDLFAGL